MKLFLLLLSFILSSQFIFAAEEIDKICYSPFSTPPLDHERYSSVNLNRAMGGLSYSRVMEDYPILTIGLIKELFKLYKEEKDPRAFQVIFLSYIPLVSKIVRTHKFRTKTN